MFLTIVIDSLKKNYCYWSNCVFSDCDSSKYEVIL